MPRRPSFILRARVVLPVARPPLDNGAVLISGRRIEAVGPWSDLRREPSLPVVDLGACALLPGLINAHCHLDYTDMAGMVPASRWFTDWIKSITALKAEWSFTEYAQSWLNGARMLLRHGVTTVADIEAVPELLPEVWQSTPLRVFSFLEMTGVKSRRAPRSILKDALETIRSLPTARGGAGLSPHALYSTPPELQRLSFDTCRKRGWRMTTHIAESTEEFDMFTRATGPMHDWLARNQRDMSDCGRGTPVQQLYRLGALGPHTLAVHANCLGPGDAALFADAQSSVAHCPRSHRFFGHPGFPFADLQAAGVNVCLGTDSLASVARRSGYAPQLDMFAEMQSFASTHPQVSPESILALATVNGAHALGLAGQLGEITPGALADLIAVPFEGATDQACEAVLHHAGSVSASLIDGEWAIPPQGFGQRV
jgi:aminodeoxyfutalosine deaminase